MATLDQIREGLATNLSTIKGCQVSAWMLDNPSPPGLYVVGPDVIEYDLTNHRGLDMWTIVIQGLTSASDDVGRHRKLDPWLAPDGATSVKAAIEADQTLDGNLAGVVGGVRVTRVEAYRDYEIRTAGQSQRLMFGAAWFVTVFNPGSS